MNDQAVPSQNAYAFVQRPTYLKINLDAMVHNVKILMGKCSPKTKMIAVLKSNACGHGSVPVARCLEKCGVSTFAIATGEEGAELRKGGIVGDIQLLGSVSAVQIPVCIENNLIPTVSSKDFLVSWLNTWQTRTQTGINNHTQDRKCGAVVIKVDTGLSRNGCQVEELPGMVKFCQTHVIPIHSIMTHFAQSLDDDQFTKQQMDSFLLAVKPFRETGVKVHVSNSAALSNGVGVDLDYVRLSVYILGIPAGTSKLALDAVRNLGLKPAMCWMAQPCLIKCLQPGRVIGYDKTYKCEDQLTVATFSLGFSDGYRRRLSNIAKFTTKEGTECPVLGRVSMDSVTVQVPKTACASDEFYVVKDDLDAINSVVSLSRLIDTDPCEFCCTLSKRIPRLYEIGGHLYTLE